MKNLLSAKSVEGVWCSYDEYSYNQYVLIMQDFEGVDIQGNLGLRCSTLDARLFEELSQLALSCQSQLQFLPRVFLF